MDQTDFDEIIRRQNMMLRSVASESETDSEIKLMSIKKVQKEAVIIEAEMQGMDEAEVNRVLAILKADHMIIEPEPGYLKRA
jgi:hypothetical protein